VTLPCPHSALSILRLRRRRRGKLGENGVPAGGRPVPRRVAAAELPAPPAPLAPSGGRSRAGNRPPQADGRRAATVPTQHPAKPAAGCPSLRRSQSQRPHSRTHRSEAGSKAREVTRVRAHEWLVPASRPPGRERCCPRSGARWLRRAHGSRLRRTPLVGPPQGPLTASAWPVLRPFAGRIACSRFETMPMSPC
jgi:hypothetical protein